VAPRKPLPQHAKDAVEHALNGQIAIQQEAHEALSESEEITAKGGPNAPWIALNKLASALGRIIRVAGVSQRELESIEGIDNADDYEGLKLVQ
jgi:hypothetical protein